ncbi:2-oxo-4-hydroxy-4-carboxy-5-ureidoimidazoline decarboxylase [Streptosporangium sandarakinum]|uniref:2-oxo-4-hydroxy-4-carboxy-5-ureidoimidazoline decarboxylase n=1 Tax=Streptosporangium sandarakinum TaxID=1260955 RepID=A0A852URG1_9ACTN|nr:2-oxo-4-hydroxy-4-carboxy-5-ureidoimidazoline decarboxylase [Streptosporangium sandarakinum]NYF38799.1 2-oxo-4-hydroxy-4-carboxy-5-ureidoimidazoline decarboxylase [Streptosporangium sandarakinum]
MPNIDATAPAGPAGFNALGAAGAEAGLLACCASPVFAREVAARRPYRDLAALESAVEAAVLGLPWPEVLTALAAHPRIGEPPRDGGAASGATGPGTGAPGVTGPGADGAGAAGRDAAGDGGGPVPPGAGGREASWSRREQSGVAGADPAVLAALAEGNRAYEARFGHIYLVRAAGLTAGEMLDRLRARLRNDEETERDVVRTELAGIARLRVARLLEDPEGTA